jgi:hypothetical protein
LDLAPKELDKSAQGIALVVTHISAAVAGNPLPNPKRSE